MGTLGKFVHRGWRFVTEAHTVHWLYSLIPAVPAVALGWWTQFVGLPAPIIATAATVAFGMLFLCLLAFLGYRASAGDLRSNINTQEAQVGSRVTARATAIPAAKYSKAQINRIREAIDAFYPPLGEIEQVLVSGTWVAGSLEATIRDKGAPEFLVQMDQLRLKLIDPSDRLDRELEKFGLYAEVCRILDEKESQQEAFFAAFNELANILRQIPDHLSAPALAIFVEAKKRTFFDRIASYLVWAQQKKKALIEYREWYLRRPTTD
jgi:hypothetical protein